MQQIQISNKVLVEKERQIILDANVYINDKKTFARIITTLAGKCCRYKLKLIVPRIVIYEVGKITGKNTNEVKGKIISIFKKFKIIYYNNVILHESKCLETKYFECHYPDSIILVTAKTTSAILVTLDKKLLRTAKLEGVEAYHLKDFQKNWRIEV